MAYTIGINKNHLGVSRTLVLQRHTIRMKLVLFFWHFRLLSNEQSGWYFLEFNLDHYDFRVSSDGNGLDGDACDVSSVDDFRIRVWVWPVKCATIRFRSKDLDCDACVFDDDDDNDDEDGDVYDASAPVRQHECVAVLLELIQIESQAVAPEPFLLFQPALFVQLSRYTAFQCTLLLRTGNRHGSND